MIVDGQLSNEAFAAFGAEIDAAAQAAMALAQADPLPDAEVISDTHAYV